MHDTLSNVRQLPTRLNVNDAWAHYQRLALEVAANPAKLSDLEHSQRLARAWARWRDLFLASDNAA